jgi:hypothetical protein
MTASIFSDRRHLEEVCRRNRIRKLSLFGSTLSGAALADSDIDLLVEFEPGGEPGLIALAGIEAELSNLTRGRRRVDLRTAADLGRRFRSEVVEKATVQYAA